MPECTFTCVLTCAHTYIHPIHVLEPSPYPPKLQLYFLPCREKILERVVYTHSLYFLTFYFFNLISILTSPSKLPSSRFFVNLLISFPEPISVLTWPSQSILKMPFSWHTIRRYSSDLPTWLFYLNLLHFNDHLTLTTSKAILPILISPIKFCTCINGVII